jgi:hypothetical protein
VCAKGIKKELTILDVADFVRDVEKSSYHQLSQIEKLPSIPIRGFRKLLAMSHRPSIFLRKLGDSFRLRRYSALDCARTLFDTCFSSLAALDGSI